MAGNMNPNVGKACPKSIYAVGWMWKNAFIRDGVIFARKYSHSKEGSLEAIPKGSVYYGPLKYHLEKAILK